MDMKNFDPEMEALSNRKAKGMRIVVDVSPDGELKASHEGKEELKEAIEEHEQDDVAQDKALISKMIDEKEAEEDAEEAEENGDEEEVKNSMMAGMSPEKIMEEYGDKKSLGAKVRMAIAKKGMKA